jgi:RNA polymerase sigma-70 factor (ECF subfamily)
MIETATQPEFSVEALRKGDRAEFARLVDAFSGPVYRLAIKILGDEQDAEDALQETFLKVYNHLGEFEGRSSLSTWIYRIAVNEALMILRQRKGPVASLDEEREGVEGDIEPSEIVDWRSLPEEELLSDEGRRLLEMAINELPASLKVVFLLRDIEGLSIRETAEALELTETAVKTRLLRARLRLRERLSVYYGEKMMEGKQ